VIAPVVEQVAAEFKDKVQVVGANLAVAGDAATELGIMSLPTLVFFKGGKEVYRMMGIVKKEKLVSEMKKRLGV
jgi:thioredoxin 1